MVIFNIWYIIIYQHNFFGYFTLWFYSLSDTSVSFNNISNRAEFKLLSFIKCEPASVIWVGWGEGNECTGEVIGNRNPSGSDLSTSERLNIVDSSGVRFKFGVNNGVDVDDVFTEVRVELGKGLEVCLYDGDGVELELNDGNDLYIVDVDWEGAKVLVKRSGIGDEVSEVEITFFKRIVVDSECIFGVEIEIVKDDDPFREVFGSEGGVLVVEGADEENEADVETDLGKGCGEDNADVYSIFGSKSIESGFIPNTPQEVIECTPASLI